MATRPDSTTTVAASITKPIARPRIGPPLIIGILLLGYFAIATIAPLLAGGAYLCDNDFGGIFLPSARYVVAGQPLDMYHVRIGIYPNANGPLGEIFIAAALAMGVFSTCIISAPPVCILTRIPCRKILLAAWRMWFMRSSPWCH